MAGSVPSLGRTVSCHEFANHAHLPNRSFSQSCVLEMEGGALSLRSKPNYANSSTGSSWRWTGKTSRIQVSCRDRADSVLLLSQGLHSGVKGWSSRRLPKGKVGKCRASLEAKNEDLQQRLRNRLLLTIGMVMSCPLLATTASTVLDDYSSNAVALETDNAAAITTTAMSDHWYSSSSTFELLHRVGIPPLADLDPGTAKLAITVLGPFFAFFNLLFIFRIIMSWYPQIPVGKFPFVIAYAPTEPILGPTRRLIPPVGGVDVAPVIWVALTSFLNEILLGKQGLFILLSQQQS